MDINELDQKLNNLWRRLQGPSAPAAGGGFFPGPPDLAAAERDLLRQTLAELRRNFDREKDRWRALLEQRDETVRSLAEEKKWLEGDIDRLRNEWNATRAEFQGQQELQALDKAEYESEVARQTRQHQDELRVYERQLGDMEAGHREEVRRFEESLTHWKEEEKAWYGMLEKKNQALAELTNRFNQMGLERQKDRALVEEEKRASAAALREGTARLEEEKRMLLSLAQTREAEIGNFQRMLALSQQEIVEFTRNRHQLDSELKSANEQISRFQNEIKTMRESWEVERGHWRELWERERASREKWYDDMRDWEDHLREEREEWLTQFRVSAAPVPTVTPAPPQGIVPPSTPEPPRRYGLEPFVGLPANAVGRRRALLRVLWFCGAALLAGGFQALRVVFPREFPAPGATFSGLAAHGQHLYYANWMTGQIVQASSRRPDEILYHGVLDETFHPVSLRWAEDRLWALDPWSRTLQERQGLAPFSPMKQWPLSEANPVDFAWDGRGFWILDGTAQTMRRHLLGDLDSLDREISLPSGWRLSALDFRGGVFWGYDDTAGKIRRFHLEDAAGAVVPFEETPLPIHTRAAYPLTALSLSEDVFWTMSEKSVTVYRWSWLTLRAVKLFKIFH